MNKAWFFGCSFTYGAGLFLDRYKDVYTPDESDIRWTQIVSEKFNLIENNLGQNSASNMYIINTISSNIDKIKEHDFVVIGLTDPTRVGFYHHNAPGTVKQMSAIAYDQTYPDGRFSRFMDKKEFTAVQNFGKYIQGPNEDAFSHYYRRVVNGYITLLNRINVKTFLWDYTMWPQFNTISEHTNNKVHDRHWSFKGNRDFANHVIDRLYEKDRYI